MGFNKSEPRIDRKKIHHLEVKEKRLGGWRADAN